MPLKEIDTGGRKLQYHMWFPKTFVSIKHHQICQPMYTDTMLTSKTCSQSALLCALVLAVHCVKLVDLTRLPDPLMLRTNYGSMICRGLDHCDQFDVMQHALLVANSGSGILDTSIWLRSDKFA